MLFEFKEPNNVPHKCQLRMYIRAIQALSQFNGLEDSNIKTDIDETNLLF